MIARKIHSASVARLLRQFPVVAVLGAKQVGKPTLARLRDPSLALSALRGLIVLDEVQRLPEVFPQLKARPDECFFSRPTSASSAEASSSLAIITVRAANPTRAAVHHRYSSGVRLTAPALVEIEGISRFSQSGPPHQGSVSPFQRTNRPEVAGVVSSIRASRPCADSSGATEPWPRVMSVRT